MDVDELFARRLASRGHRFDWLLQSSSATAPFEEPWGGGIAWIAATCDGSTMEGRSRRLLRALSHDFRILALSRRKRYDLVIVKDKFAAVLVASLASRWYGVPFAYWLSFPFPESTAYKAESHPWPRRFLDRLRARLMALVLYRLVPRYARHIFVQSTWMKEQLSAKGIDPTQMTAVPMGVPLERVTVHDDVTSAEAPSAIYVGALNKARRIEFLLRAFDRVLERVPQAILYVVGSAHDPDDERRLRELAGRLGIDHAVRFVDFVPTDEAWCLVRQALIGVSPIPPTPEFLPSSPTKVVEYLALERAVVANDLPDQALVLESSGAGRCVPYCEAAFADAMTELLQHPHQTLELGRRGRPWVERHRSYAHIADLVERTLYRITEAAPPQRSSPR